MAPRIDTEEEIDWAPSSVLFESLIEPLVSGIGRAPNLVFERLLYVVFSVRLDHEITSLKRPIRKYGEGQRSDNEQTRGAYRKFGGYSP